MGSNFLKVLYSLNGRLSYQEMDVCPKRLFFLNLAIEKKQKQKMNFYCFLSLSQFFIIRENVKGWRGQYGVVL